MQAVGSSSEVGQPKVGWIVLLALSLWVFWPAGLVVFAFLLLSGRLDAWKRAGMNFWHEGTHQMRQPGTWWSPPASGNKAFDQYRSDTLRRLEEEEREFREYLDRLRAAKDKSEFDQFMADRRNRAGNQNPIQS